MNKNKAKKSIIHESVKRPVDPRSARTADDVTSNRVVREMESRIRELERQLGCKTMEVEDRAGLLDEDHEAAPLLKP